MSRTGIRKHVILDILGDDTPPTSDQQIVKVLGSKGNNLHCVEAPDGSNFLVSMPKKFRNFWIIPGDYVIVDPIKEGVKVKGEIVRILTPELMKSLKRDGIWPSAFDDKKKSDEQENNAKNELFRNYNRKVIADEISSSESDVEIDD